jgi:1,2-dihydroxy-3-keto-5-methylthiopentene dioxygenase
MTTMTVYDDCAPWRERTALSDHDAIARVLEGIGITLERWEAGVELGEAPQDDAILTAYDADIERLKAAGGYQTADVLRVTPDHPQRDALRQKFLSEHIHDDDEVRFFVEGAGLFYIRKEGKVHAIECTRGDLILLPAGTTHWFDTGAKPNFTVIRIFTTPEGWVARYTGDTIAENIPLYEGAA